MKTIAFAAAFLAVVYVAQAIECPPKNDADVTLLPNPEDCSSFYLCNDGIPYYMFCPVGLHFNPRLRVCDLPENARCVSSGPSTTPEPEEPSTVSESPQVNSTTENTNETIYTTANTDEPVYTTTPAYETTPTIDETDEY